MVARRVYPGKHQTLKLVGPLEGWDCVARRCAQRNSTSSAQRPHASIISSTTHFILTCLFFFRANQIIKSGAVFALVLNAAYIIRVYRYVCEWAHSVCTRLVYYGSFFLFLGAEMEVRHWRQIITNNGCARVFEASSACWVRGKKTRFAFYQRHADCE
jgi:hypothetical protein